MSLQVTAMALLLFASGACGCIVPDIQVRLADGAAESADASRELSTTDAPTEIAGAACGNTRCDDGESTSSCCRDCGCGNGQICLGNGCVEKPVAISAGGDHSCVLLFGGAVSCWGSNLYGEVGDGSTDTRVLLPSLVSGLSGARSIAAGSTFTCALLADRSVACWGSNSAGQLGNGGGLDSRTPVAVSGLKNAVAIAAGYDFACAALEDQTVRCWGKNDAGQLGDGTTKSAATPVLVDGLTTARSLAAGFDFACARLSSGGSVACWGANYSGQLGRGANSTTPCLTPCSVAGVRNATQVVAMCDRYAVSLIPPESPALGSACALLADGTAMCWGSAMLGALGNPNADDPSTTAIAVSNLSAAEDLAAGYAFACAVVSQTVKCWGNNTSSQLGTPSSQLQSTAVLTTVPALTTATNVAAGSSHACALLSDGAVRCWGSNAQGQLGDGTDKASAAPVKVTW